MSEQDVTLEDFSDSSGNQNHDQTWEGYQLRELVEQLQAGGTPDTDKNEYYDGDIPWVKTGELGQLNVASTGQSITEQGLEESAARLFPSKTVLIAMYGATTGEVSILDIEAATNQACCGIIPNKRLNPYYLYYQLVRGKKQLESLSAGSGQQNISKSILEKYKLPVAPLPEQRKIATVLHTVDQAIQKTEEIIERGERLHTGLRRDLVISGIDHREFQKMRIGPFEYEIPASWEIVSVDEACTNLDKDRIPVKKSKREEMEGSIPYYGASGIIDYVDDYLFKNDLILLAEDGENLRARNSPISFKISGKAWVNNHAHVFKPKKEFVIDYLVGYFERLNYEPFVTGSAQPKLTQANMEMLSVPKPPKNEQAEISSVLTSISGFKNKLEQNVNRMEHLKKGLMQDLLSGEVRTTDVDIDIPEKVAKYG